MSSKVLWRELPGIRVCGIWEEMEERPSQGERPLALITDIGNDLLYGAIPDQILRWVEKCIDRLEEQGADIVITELPMESVAKLGRARYALMKSILFPGKGPTWQHMHELAQSLNRGLREMANRRGLPAVRPAGNWYGFDPIHIRRSRRAAAVDVFFSAWSELADTISVQSASGTQAVRHWRLRPASRTLFGRQQQTPQPSVTLEDGSLIYLY